MAGAGGPRLRERCAHELLTAGVAGAGSHPRLERDRLRHVWPSPALAGTNDDPLYLYFPLSSLHFSFFSSIFLYPSFSPLFASCSPKARWKAPIYIQTSRVFNEK